MWVHTTQLRNHENVWNKIGIFHTKCSRIESNCYTEFTRLVSSYLSAFKITCNAQATLVDGTHETELFLG